MIRILSLGLVLLATMGVQAKDLVMKKSDPQSVPAIAPVADKAVLVFIRITSYAFADVVDNYVDGKWVGQTKGKSYYITQVEPGMRYVCSAWRKKEFVTEKANFEAGRIYFLSQAIFPTGFRPGLAINIKTAEEAKQQMPECGVLTFEPGKVREDMDTEEYGDAVKDFEAQVKKDPASKANVTKYKGYEKF